MDFLGNILSGQDLVNKDYVDKAIPVVPTKLSELTDDILSGKYLLLSGGTINGNLSVNNGNIVSNYASGGVILSNGASFYFKDSTGTNRKVVRLATGNVLQLGSTALETAITSGGTIALSANTSVNGILSVATDITTPLINGGTPIHSGNYSDYALPLSGGTVTGTIEFTASTPALKFYRDYGNVPYIHFGASPTSGYGEVGADKNGNLVFWSLVSGNSAYNAWNTVLHAKNIGEYNAGSATKLATARTIWGQSFDGTGNVSGSLILPYGSTIQLGSPDGNTCQVFAYDANNNVNICSISAKVGHGTNIYGNNVKVHYGTNRKVGLILNSSGNVTIGGSDTAGTDYKLRVDGKSRFTDRVSVASLRIVPVNGSYAADFAIDGSSLTLNRELKFTNVTASDICSGIAAAFKTSLAQAENLIARNIILGASSGSASNLAFSFQKYTSISNTAPNGLTTLMTLTTDGNLGIGTESPSEKLHVVGKGLFTDILTAKGGINVTASDGALNTGQSGVAGVFLRNEGGIEITHASTPYIDFHHEAGTTDFSHRLIARASNIFAYSGNYFCPWGSESLGASSYRWKAVYAKAGNFLNDMEINGALTVGAGATFNGDVRINGNLVVTGDTASGGAGQETTSTSLGAIELDMDGIIGYGGQTNIATSVIEGFGLTSQVIDNMLQGKYTKVIYNGTTQSSWTYEAYRSGGDIYIYIHQGGGDYTMTEVEVDYDANTGKWKVYFREI